MNATPRPEAMIQTDEMDQLCAEVTKSLAEAYGGEAAYRKARMAAVAEAYGGQAAFRRLRQARVRKIGGGK